MTNQIMCRGASTAKLFRPQIKLIFSRSNCQKIPSPLKRPETVEEMTESEYSQTSIPRSFVLRGPLL